MPDYVKAAATAKRLVEGAGRPVDVFKHNTTPDNPAQPWRGVSGPPTAPEGGATMAVIATFVPASGPGFGKMVTDAEGELTVVYDQIALVASSSIPTGSTVEDLEDADSMRDGSDLWRIVAKGHLKPGPTSLLFVLGLKR